MTTKVAIATLILLLLGTNAFWLYQFIDAGVTASYKDGELYELRGAEAQSVAMLEKALVGKSKNEVLQLATQFSDSAPFEKDGCLWVGWYGFKFTSEDRLSGISSIYVDENSKCEDSRQ